MDATGQGLQGIGVIKFSSMMNPTTRLERKVEKPQKDQALNCPRCNSTNTKFCYYNNYSLSQPRYFCKTCRRYWTEGGSQRNVPVGGGSRKNKRPSSSSAANISSNPSKKVASDNPHQMVPLTSGNYLEQGQDLNTAYPPPVQDRQDYTNHIQNPSFSGSSAFSVDHYMLKSGTTTKGLIGSFVPMPVTNANSIYETGFCYHEPKPGLKISPDGFEDGGGGTVRMLFPVHGYDNQDLKPDYNNGQFDQNKGDTSGGYWSRMLGNEGSHMKSKLPETF